ncbi:MAG: site-2 protease family protein [Gemmatimonadaceae bacterium]
MRWSWKIGRIAGIQLDVHATFFVLLAWIALASYRVSGTLSAAAQAVAFIVAIFLSVVLHELGHALMARRYGVKTRGITLLPIGGVARLERIPDRPAQELAIALAGPAVTVALVILLYAVLRLMGTATDPRAVVPGTELPFLARLMWVNVILAAFNLLPAFPMDGGRVLRAALAMRTDHARATEVAARVGKMFALLFGILGLFVLGNPFLVIIALFVWIGAAGEAMAAQIKAVVADVPVASVMATDIRELSPGDRLSAAIEQVQAGFQDDFPVTDDHTIAGILTREALLKALADGKGDLTVGDVMQRTFVTAEADEPLERAMTRLQGCHCRTLPVVRDQSLVGLLTMEKIGEFVAIEAASRKASAR